MYSSNIVGNDLNVGVVVGGVIGGVAAVVIIIIIILLICYFVVRKKKGKIYNSCSYIRSYVYTYTWFIATCTHEESSYKNTLCRLNPQSRIIYV